MSQKNPLEMGSELQAQTELTAIWWPPNIRSIYDNTKLRCFVRVVWASWCGDSRVQTERLLGIGGRGVKM